MSRAVLTIALYASACGRVGFDAMDGGSGGDTPDASANCFASWRTGVPPLSTPQLMIDDNADENDAVLSPDGLRLYYATNRDGPYHTYYSERPALDGNFHEVGIATEFPLVQRVNVAFVDELAAYAIDLAAPDNYDITLYKRGTAAALFQAVSDPAISVLNSSVNDIDVYVAPDALSLYFARRIAPSDFDIYRSTRPTSSVAWATPTPIPPLADPGVAELDPYLTPDGLTMLYSTQSPAPKRVYITTRASTSDEFAPGTPVDLGDASSINHDAVLSPNGCELYFSSTRTNGNESLFRATVLP